MHKASSLLLLWAFHYRLIHILVLVICVQSYHWELLLQLHDHVLALSLGRNCITAPCMTLSLTGLLGIDITEGVACLLFLLEEVGSLLDWTGNASLGLLTETEGGLVVVELRMVLGKKGLLAGKAELGGVVEAELVLVEDLVGGGGERLFLWVLGRVGGEGVLVAAEENGLLRADALLVLPDGGDAGGDVVEVGGGVGGDALGLGLGEGFGLAGVLEELVRFGVGLALLGLVEGGAADARSEVLPETRGDLEHVLELRLHLGVGVREDGVVVAQVLVVELVPQPLVLRLRGLLLLLRHLLPRLPPVELLLLHLLQLGLPLRVQVQHLHRVVYQVLLYLLVQRRVRPKRRRRVHLDQVRLQLVVQDHVEPQDLKADGVLQVLWLLGTVLVEKCGLSADDGPDNDFLYFAFHLLPIEVLVTLFQILIHSLQTTFVPHVILLCVFVEFKILRKLVNGVIGKMHC